jgi:antitoxin component YwqK of YwqJK toxin-antitoxin module
MHFLFLYLSIIYFVIFSQGCGTPDLTQPDIQKKACLEAIPLESLERKRMYEMIMLYVDSDDEPYTGWVKSEINGTLAKLGYLKKGQRQGIWMQWFPNGMKQSEIEWENDRMSGSFHTWHPNGIIRVVGQTKDGEVDGTWKEYYANGQLEAHSQNKMGTLVEINVMHNNGEPCKNSKVVNGNGTFTDYDTDGIPIRARTFKNGIEVETTWFNRQTP